MTIGIYRPCEGEGTAAEEVYSTKMNRTPVNDTGMIRTHSDDTRPPSAGMDILEEAHVFHAEDIRQAPADMRQELRTHMNAIIELADRIMQPGLIPTQYGNICQLRTSTNTLSRIINEILDEEISPGLERTFTGPPPLQPETKSARLVPPPDLLWLRVLLVDDNETARTGLSDTLKSFTFDPHAAVSGAQALELMAAAAKPYDLILLDWRMPDMDGRTFIQRIKQEPRFRDIPIILISACAREEESEQAQASGAQAFLIKPIRPSVLFETILDVFGRRDDPEENPIQPAYDTGTNTADRRPETPTLRHDPLQDNQFVPTSAAGQDKPIQTDDLPEAMPGLDIKAALVRLGGNGSLYRKLLTQFVRQYAACPHDFREALAREDTTGIRHLAHALRGVAGNLSALDVQENARVLESLATGEPGPDLGALIDQFEQSWLTVRESAASLERKQDAQPVTLQTPPASDDRTAVTALMLKLRDRLRQNDIEAEDCLDELLRRFDPILRHPDMNTLLEQVGAFDFEHALITLEALLDHGDMPREPQE